MKPHYWSLRDKDILYWVQPLLDTKRYKCRRSDGRFELAEVTEPTDSPWHHIHYAEGADCPWMHFLFQHVSPRTPIGQFVPRRCHSCWKVVIRPLTLKQLFALEGVLLRLDVPSKCGIERRSYTPPAERGARYGGYIYNTSVEEGLDRLDLIREEIADNFELEGTVAYLKRACTEMEMAAGPSGEWKLTDKQHEIENRLDWLVVNDIPLSYTAKHMIDSVHMRWIEWACENGDETYLEYTDGKPLYRPAVRYERKAEEVNADTLDSEAVDLSPSVGEVPKGRVRRTAKGKGK